MLTALTLDVLTAMTIDLKQIKVIKRQNKLQIR